MTQTFTLTFGNCAENHKGMQKIGCELKEGFTFDEICEMYYMFEGLGAKLELYDLNGMLPEGIETDNAYLLVIRNGLDVLLGCGFKDKLFDEQKELKKDDKAYMYGRVVNKKARYNLCFSDFDQVADYENKKGTVINFKNLPLLNELREKLMKVIDSEKVKGLQCEGNYYYDVKNTYIGFHGDAERHIVIAARLGADFPSYYQWYYKNEKISGLFEVMLSHGDMYVMSDKAVGRDWKKKNIPTLRHAACAKDNKNVFRKKQ